jgi:hypothetical protein
MLRKRREIQKRRQVPVEYIKALLKESSRAASASIRRRLAHLVRSRLRA